MNGDIKNRTAVPRSVVILGWGLGLLMVCGALGMASVGVAGLVAGTGTPHGWDQLSAAFSVVNGVFSVLALVIVAMTLWVQFNELRMQRVELRMQRRAAEQSQEELHRAAAAAVREQHVHLLHMAIEDPDLAAVWPEYAPGISSVQRKQFLYTNLILSHFNLIGTVVLRDRAYSRKILADTFRSPIVQDFWATVRADRRQMRPPESLDAAFDDLCEAAYQEALRNLHGNG